MAEVIPGSQRAHGGLKSAGWGCSGVPRYPWLVLHYEWEQPESHWWLPQPPLCSCSLCELPSASVLSLQPCVSSLQPVCVSVQPLHRTPCVCSLQSVCAPCGLLEIPTACLRSLQSVCASHNLFVLPTTRVCAPHNSIVPHTTPLCSIQPYCAPHNPIVPHTTLF